MNWLLKEVNGKVVYVNDRDDFINPRITIRQLPSGKYLMEDKLLGIKKESTTFEKLTNNFISEICVRSIELKFLRDNVKSISWDMYFDEDVYYSREIYRFLISNYSRSRKNRMKLKELDDGSYVFNWNFQGSKIEIFFKDKDDKDEKTEFLNKIHSLFASKEDELNNVLVLFKEV